jgi:CheY-like chemotaxis protein
MAVTGSGERNDRLLLWMAANTTDAELSLARAETAALARVIECRSAAEAVADAAGRFNDAPPTVAVLASDCPGRWSLADAVVLSRRWPLTPVVSVAASLADGRRRSGPPLPGVEEVPWSDWPGRLAWWFAELDRGRPGPLGMPPTARRDERLLEAVSRIATVGQEAAGLRISVAAHRAADVEPLCDLITAMGQTVVRRASGRPAVDQDADLLLWDVGDCDATQLSWLRMLAANQPDLGIVLLESFPRAETAALARAAGAVAVLSRPLSLESLSGTVLRVNPASFGLGGPGRHG